MIRRGLLIALAVTTFMVVAISVSSLTDDSLIRMAVGGIMALLLYVAVLPVWNRD